MNAVALAVKPGNSTTAARQRLPLPTRRKAYDVAMRAFMWTATAATCLLAVFVMGYVLAKGLPELSLPFVTTKPSYLSGTIGILPDLLNTVYLIATSLMVTVPLGVGAAVYLNEYAANRRLVAAVEYAAETLAGIPSIIYGLAGMLVFCTTMGLQYSLLAGALTLAVMNLPTLMRTTQEALKTVPQSYREGAFGLGAGKWRVIRTVVLPGCADGILVGSILAVGRMLGESAALLFTAGFAHAVYLSPSGLLAPGASLSVALYVYAKEQGEFGVAFAIAAILMALTLVLNLTAIAVAKRFRAKA